MIWRPPLFFGVKDVDCINDKAVNMESQQDETSQQGSSSDRYAGRYPNPWKSGWQGRCPRCGQGRLYESFLKVADRCNACDLDLSQEDAGDGAVPFLILLIGTIGVLFGLIFMLGLDWPVWATIAITFPVIIGLTLYSIPKAKGLLIALQFVNHAGDTGHNTFKDE